MLVQAIAIFGAVFAAFQMVSTLSEFSWNWTFNGARTYAFVALICAELFRAYSSRSEHYSVFSIGLFSNRFMIRATLISLAMLLVVLYVPFLEPIFDTVFLGIADWGILLLLALIPSPPVKCLN